MSSFNFDSNNVKAEKAAAMRRYSRQKKLKSFLFLIEVLAALALLLWYSTYYVPVVSDVAADFLRRFVVLFGRSLYVFLIVNVLVVAIFVLSCQKPAKPEFYNEYVSVTATVSGRRVTSASASTVDHSPEPDESFTTVGDRQIVCVNNAVNNPPAEKSLVRTTTATALMHCDSLSIPAVSSVPQNRVGAVIETKKYRRTRSDRYGKDKRPELRRSETVIKRETSTVGEEVARRSLSPMDDLTSEEFRKTIETFIASKKKSLIRENTLDFKLERKECVSITLSRFN